jgi:NTP pyrophosphatase (non-canonical NTP hydrolase)
MKHELEVIDWADQRGLLDPGNERNQLIKTYEELGEVSRALLKNDREALVDGLGDVMVTLIIFSRIKGLSLEDCLGAAYDVIKNRTGKTVKGVFIKNE